MSNNTDHHLKYITRLLEDITDDGVTEIGSERFEKRFNKLIYCQTKLRYNITSGRADPAYVADRLTVVLDALEPWVKHIAMSAAEIVGKRQGQTYVPETDA